MRAPGRQTGQQINHHPPPPGQAEQINKLKTQNMKRRFMNGGMIIIILSIMIFGGCAEQTKKTAGNEDMGYSHPEWSNDIVLYELNIRQFTEEGTFAAVEGHIDRLSQLGVDVIWFMPIHPIGELNRKGTLGSYYSVKDFKDVNPDFGSLDDFKSLVEKIHDAGMYVMMDWVPNHSAWDNPLATEHPDWYYKDSSGVFVSPYDWTDVIQFDWSNEDLQEYMHSALMFWVEELDIDGYRVDHPHVTPADFWLKARNNMEAIKPVLMLAENEDRVEFFENGFDMNYSWELHHIMNEVAQGKRKHGELDEALKRDIEKFPADGFRLRFITNHDENSWAGTIEERMGDAHKAFAVYMYTIPGVPLLYNGQEVGLNKRLEFFEKDPIEWKESELSAFYTQLNKLKKDNIALHNGSMGGCFSNIATEGSDNVYAYSREKDDNMILCILNFSDEAASFSISDDAAFGDYSNYFSGENISLGAETKFDLDGWGYIILTN